jgi:hypothetical protein
LEKACDLHLIRLYNLLNLHHRLDRPKTSNALATELSFVDSAAIALEAVLLRLAAHTALISADISAEQTLFLAKMPGSDTERELADIHDELARMGEGYLAALEFIDSGAEHFCKALGEGPDFMDEVLTGRKPLYWKLWHRATNLDPLQDLHGEMGARIINRIFQGGNIPDIGGVILAF